MNTQQTIRELDALIEKSKTQDSLTPNDTEQLRKILAFMYERIGQKKIAESLKESC